MEKKKNLKQQELPACSTAAITHCLTLVVQKKQMTKMLSWVRGTKSVQDFLWGVHHPCPLLRKNKLGSQQCFWKDASSFPQPSLSRSRCIQGRKGSAVLTLGIAASPRTSPRLQNTPGRPQATSEINPLPLFVF